MSQTNAQRQRAYRNRHLKLTHPPEAMLERINQIVSPSAKNTLKRLASYYGLTHRAMLETVLANAERALFETLPGEQHNDYYDGKLTLRSNAKQRYPDSRSLTAQTGKD